jgi:hypothetical protein
VWKYRFAPRRAGNYKVRVRAVDGDGRAQPPSDPDTSAGQSAQARLSLDVTAAA